jgi:hypothetical protein
VDKVNTDAAGSPRVPRLMVRNSIRLRSRRSHPFLLWALVLITWLPSTTPVHAQEARPTPTQVEAAYLFNFGKFVRWQIDRTAPSDSFGICVLGKDPFGAVLDSTVAGERIGGKHITVGKLSRMQEASDCSVLYISSSEEARLGPILASAQRLSLLTVSDIPHFAERGGIIGLVAQQSKIRFEVNRTVAEQSNLVLSSELLKIATRVIDKPVPVSHP